MVSFFEYCMLLSYLRYIYIYIYIDTRDLVQKTCLRPIFYLVLFFIIKCVDCIKWYQIDDLGKDEDKTLIF